MSVLLLGAGGFLGLNTVDALNTVGVSLRCGRRKRSNVLGLRQRKVALVEADLDQPQTLREAMRGCSTVVHLAGHYPRLSNQRLHSLELAVRQVRGVLDAAAETGVERLIYVSSTATVASKQDRLSDERDVFSTAPGFGVYHDLKWAMEEEVRTEQRLRTVTLCPGACLGPHDWKAGTSAVLWQLRGGQCPAHPDGVVSWVDVRDVGLAIARLVTSGLAPPRLLLSAQSVPFHEFLTAAASRYHAGPVPAALSAEAAVALADSEELRASLVGGRPHLSREIVDLVVHGARIDGSRARSLFGFEYRSLQETLDVFDAWAQRMGAGLSTLSEVHT